MCYDFIRTMTSLGDRNFYLHYHLMGPLSYMWTLVEWNVIMWCMTICWFQAPSVCWACWSNLNSVFKTTSSAGKADRGDSKIRLRIVGTPYFTYYGPCSMLAPYHKYGNVFHIFPPAYHCVFNWLNKLCNLNIKFGL